MLVQNELEKSPGDVRRFAMDFSSLPELASGTIASITSITASPDGLTLSSQQIDSGSKSVSCIISGGVNGKPYNVTFKVVTSGGQTLERTGTLYVKVK